MRNASASPLLALHDYSHPKVMNAKIVADVGGAALIRLPAALHIAQGAPTLISVALSWMPKSRLQKN